MFAQRDTDGKIIGLYSDPMDGIAEEFIAMDDPAVVAFLAPIVIQEAVSARQFKLALLAAGLLDTVDAWVKTQDRSVQIAYEYSGSFVRDEPMMTVGFRAMGFADPQIDAFFASAIKL